MSRQTEMPAELLARARHVVYERLALFTAVVWFGGAALLFAKLVPDTTTGPNTQIVLSMMLPIAPAALPWLLYGSISRWLARRWASQASGNEQATSDPR